jgi:hypothetical protein
VAITTRFKVVFKKMQLGFLVDSPFILPLCEKDKILSRCLGAASRETLQSAQGFEGLSRR